MGPRWKSVAPVTLLKPGIPAVVVAVALPEARPILLAEDQAAHPLGALPEVQMRDEQARRSAVLGLQRLAVEVERDPGLAAGDVLERQVRVVAAVAHGDRVLGLGLHALEQRVHRDALPARPQLGPRGDAVDVARDRLRRERAELLPAP